MFKQSFEGESLPWLVYSLNEVYGLTAVRSSLNDAI